MNEQPIIFKGITEVFPHSASDNVSTAELPKLTVDGQKFDHWIFSAGNGTTPSRVYTYEIPLSGRTQYSVHREMRSIQCLDTDDQIFFQLTRFAMGLQLIIEYPEELQLRFEEIGTNRAYEDLSRQQRFFMKTSRLLFPNQGYLITLTLKHTD